MKLFFFGGLTFGCLKPFTIDFNKHQDTNFKRLLLSL